MMFRDTGPGRVDIDLNFSGVGVLKALLWNFDFDDFAGYKHRGLKPGHKDFLNEKVVPLLQNDAGNIWMCGMASRIGTAKWNQTLSDNRVITVANYLGQMGINGDQIETDAIGDTLAAKHMPDEDRDRAVALWVLPKTTLHSIVKPPLPRHVPPKPKVARNFKIAQVVELDVSLALKVRELVGKIVKGRAGAGIAFATMIFTIWDTENHLKCTYLYAAVGAGVSLAIPHSHGVSATTHGDWNEFQTEKPISCAQFGPTMRFTTIGIGSLSMNWIDLETPPGVNDVYTNISTGTTLGGGLATYPAHLSAFIPLHKPSPFHGP